MAAVAAAGAGAAAGAIAAALWSAPGTRVDGPETITNPCSLCGCRVLEQKNMLEEQQTTLGVLSDMATATKAQKKTMAVRTEGTIAALALLKSSSWVECMHCWATGMWHAGGVGLVV